MSEPDSPNSMSLEQLNGAILKWTDADGTERHVQFEDTTSK